MGRTFRDGDIRFWESDSLEEHVALIRRQVERSLDDPELPELVRRVVDNEPGPRGTLHAWGSIFKCPKDGAQPGDTKLERDRLALMRIWNFVALNWSYIEDPPGFDLFAVIKYGMNARAHAAMLEKLEVPAGETTRMVRDHIKRLRSVSTPGAGDCDDAVIVLGSMLREASFTNVRGRVVSIDGKNYGHIYTMVGLPRSVSSELLALDPTVKGATPGWEYPKSKVVVDFEL